ncbi:MAG: helix-turn-helix domain-containing protein, partial [Alkalispirochaeta sp.]
ADRRRLVGISQEKLAQRAGVSLNTIGRFERGEVDPELSTIIAIYRALEIGRIDVNDCYPVFY